MLTKLSLSENPNTDLLAHVAKYGGKLGVLELISKLYQENPDEFDAIGIRVGPSYTPIIVPPGQDFTEDQYYELLSRYGLKSDDMRELLIRGSLPGDYRSLVDVVPTEKLTNTTQYYKTMDIGHGIHEYSSYRDDYPDRVETLSDRINATMRHIRRTVDHYITRKGIGDYARLSGVPFTRGTLSFGVVPKFSRGHLTVTEHPNLVDTFIEEHFSGNMVHPGIFRIHASSGGNSLSTKVHALLTLLRTRGIFDTDIAYSLELGRDQESNIILYQVRELCKKIPTHAPSLSLRGYTSEYIDTILTTLPIGESRAFIYRSTASFDRITDAKGDPEFGKFLASRSALSPNSLNPNGHGLMTANCGQSTLGGHNIMRQAQYALQSEGGGIVVLGRDSDGYDSHISEIERDFRPIRITPYYDENDGMIPNYNNSRLI